MGTQASPDTYYETIKAITVSKTLYSLNELTALSVPNKILTGLKTNTKGETELKESFAAEIHSA